MERQTFHSPILLRLQKTLDKSAARNARHLSMLAAVPGYLRQEYVAAFCAGLLAGTHLALFTERWRRNHRQSVSAALAALGEFEALLCLAIYSADHPADPFPELLEGGPLFQADELGHPLLPECGAIRNSVDLGFHTRLLIVSGSNMSGKSTLLRAVGLNTVLAWAGAPVRASRLRVSRLAVGASIGISDSLLDGKSRFYAEVERLRAIMTLAENLPVLFLLDEILSGTNSQDRLAGAEAVVAALIRAGAVGLITTHDLSLTDIAATHARNVHFSEQFQDGEMTFDYRMKPGILDHTNGCAVLRMLGIEVTGS